MHVSDGSSIGKTDDEMREEYARDNPEPVARCPEGHTAGLQVRYPADFPLVLCDGKVAPADVKPDHVELCPPNDPGVCSGVWCPTCEEWYTESDIEEATENADD